MKQVHTPQSVSDIGVGQRLRQIRMRYGFSLRALAAASKLNVNTLSLIENNRTSPSVNTLELVANALGVPLSAFFEIEPSRTGVIFQKHTQRLKSPGLQGSLVDLTLGIQMNCGKPFLVNLRPNANSGPVPIVHTGFELVFCIAGHLVYTIEKNAYSLKPGDSLWFEAHLRHCWQNPGFETAQFLLFLSPFDKFDHGCEGHFNPE